MSFYCIEQKVKEREKKKDFGGKNISYSSFKINLTLFFLGTTKTFNKCSIMRTVLRQQPAEPCLDYGHI